jgi:hypothetical protein
MRKNLLLNPDPQGDASAGTGDPEPTPAPAPAGAPPPAAKRVLETGAKESDAAELVELRRKLEDEKSGRKKDQTRINELEDSIRRLTTPPAAGTPKEKKGWLDGDCTIL